MGVDPKKLQLLINAGFYPVNYKQTIKTMKVLRLSVDVTKLKKEAFYEGKKGTYVKLSLVETPDNEFNTHVIFQDLGKDANGDYIKSEIVGGVKRWKEEPTQNEDITDLPF